MFLARCVSSLEEDQEGLEILEPSQSCCESRIHKSLHIEQGISSLNRVPNGPFYGVDVFPSQKAIVILIQ
jgi:hypothetical protein